MTMCITFLSSCNLYEFCLRFCSFQTMDKAHSRFRIGLTTAIMLFSIVGSWIAIRQGKHAVEMGGESVYDKNRQRYQDESDTKQ